MARRKVLKENCKPEIELNSDLGFGMAALPCTYTRLGRGDYFVALCAGLVALVIYWMTLAPTVTAEDSGELITAAYTMGVAHPPGYPLWCMLAKLFTVIIPFGNIARRVAMLSMMNGATTTFLVCLLGIKLFGNRIAAFGAALAFAFSSQFWGQCVVAEVYSLNVLLMVCCLLCLIAWYEKRRTRDLLLFGLAYGLGLCNHNTMHFLGPLFAVFLLSLDWQPWLRWKMYCSLVGLVAAIWLLCHLYLPVRAATNPPMNWGNPSTWENFWDVVMRKQYAFALHKNPRTLGRYAGQLWTFTKQYSGEFTPWLAVLPFAGIYPLWKRERRRAGLLFGLFAYMTLGLIFIINFDQDKESIWVNSTFFIPSYLVMALLMGVGITWLTQLVPLTLRTAFCGAFALLASALPLTAHYRDNDKSNYYFAYDFGMNTFRTLEPNALYFPTADHATFPLLYLQAVEGIRTDVTLGNKYGYPEEAIYKDMPFDQRIRFGKIPSNAEAIQIEDWVIAHTDRPVYFTKKRGLQGTPGATMANAGLLYRVQRSGEKFVPQDFWSTYQWHTVDEQFTRGDYSAEIILGDYHFFRGRDALERGNIAGGMEELAGVLRIVGETKETLNNVATLCAEYRQFTPAADYYRRALTLDPGYVLSLQNYAKVLKELGQTEDAVKILQYLVALQPDDMGAQFELVDCLKQSGHPDEALQQLNHLAKARPDDAKVQREIGMLLLNEKHQPEQARQHFTQSLRLNPKQSDLLMLMQHANGPEANPDIPNPMTPQLPNAANPQIPQPQMPQIPQPQAPQMPQMQIPQPKAPQITQIPGPPTTFE